MLDDRSVARDVPGHHRHLQMHGLPGEGRHAAQKFTSKASMLASDFFLKVRTVARTGVKYVLDLSSRMKLDLNLI